MIMGIIGTKCFLVHWPYTRMSNKSPSLSFQQAAPTPRPDSSGHPIQRKRRRCQVQLVLPRESQRAEPWKKETRGLSSYLRNYLPQRLLIRQTFTRVTTERLGVCTNRDWEGQCRCIVPGCGKEVAVWLSEAYKGRHACLRSPEGCVFTLGSGPMYGDAMEPVRLVVQVASQRIP
jgi:hypothetical protein